jgi:hypothetical protein
MDADYITDHKPSAGLSIIYHIVIIILAISIVFVILGIMGSIITEQGMGHIVRQGLWLTGLGLGAYALHKYMYPRH